MKQLQSIYQTLVNALLTTSDLTPYQLFNSRSEQCVTARAVLINVLVQIGCTESDITELSGMSQQRVNSLKNSAKYRLKGLSARLLNEELQKIISDFKS